MRTWVELDGRQVPVELVVPQQGGAVTARATVDVTVTAPNAAAAVQTLRAKLRATRQPAD